jgi:hypothetical protein
VNAATVAIGRAEASGAGADGEADGANLVVDATDSIAIGTGIAANDIRLTSPEGTISSTGSLSAGRDLLARAGGGISLVNASAGRDVRLLGGNVRLTGTGEAGRLFLVRGIDLTLGVVDSDGTEPDEEA